MADKPQGLTELTPETLQALMTAAMKAARAPSEEDAAKQDEEKRRMAQRRANMIRMGKAAEQEKINRQLDCERRYGHKRPDGKWAAGGQEMSNSREIRICLRCQKVLSDTPTQEMTLAQAELQRLSDAGRLKIVNGKVEVTAAV